MMKQKMVIKISLNGKKSCLSGLIKASMNEECSRTMAMTIAASLPGIESIAIEGAAKDELVVIGDGIDSVVLTYHLRKCLVHAELISVGPHPPPKPDPPKEEPKQKPKPKPKPDPYCPPQRCPPPFEIYEVSGCNREPGCTIM